MGLEEGEVDLVGVVVDLEVGLGIRAVQGLEKGQGVDLEMAQEVDSEVIGVTGAD